MPIYTFICNTKKCGNTFELVMSMSQYDLGMFECPICHNHNVSRSYITDIPQHSIKLSDNQITVGHLSSRNTERFSNDYKKHLKYKHNKYRYQEPEKDPPKGMTRTRKRNPDD